MASLGTPISHRVRVLSVPAGTPVTGLTGAAFTATLIRKSGSMTVAAAEAVTFTEISSGYYWASYTPTAAITLYILSIAVVSASHLLDAPQPFEDEVFAGAIPGTGPYLTTREAFKTAWGIDKSADDARIDALLPQITDLFETLCDRVFFQGTVTEYPRIEGYPVRSIFLRRPPITTPITSLHFSTSFPRVYDGTTVLVEGTDFIVDEATGIVEFVSSRSVWYGTTLKAIRAVYIGGYATIPYDLERAAQEVLGVKLYKGKDALYHFLSEAKNDGSMQGIRFDDLTPNALTVIESYRLRVFA